MDNSNAFGPLAEAMGLRQAEGDMPAPFGGPTQANPGGGSGVNPDMSEFAGGIPPQQQGPTFDHEQRKQGLRDLLGNFLYALGQGMQAGGGSQGFGAAVGAPFQLARQNQQMQMAQQERESEIAHRQALERNQIKLAALGERRAGELERHNQAVESQTNLIEMEDPDNPGQTVRIPQKDLAKWFTERLKQKGATTRTGMTVEAANKRFDTAQANRQAMAEMNAHKVDPAIAAIVGDRPAQTPGQSPDDYRKVLEHWGKEVYQLQLRKTMAAGEARAMAFNMYRPVTVADPDNPGNVIFMPFKDAIGQTAASRTNIDRAMQRTALMNDMRGAAQTVKENADVLDRGGGTRAMIAASLADPKSTMETFMQSPVASKLDEKERGYVIGVLNLREQAMALRSVLGAGQSSEEQRRAIWKTIPNASTPDSKYAAGQIDQFEKVLGRLSKGIAQIPGITSERAGKTFMFSDGKDRWNISADKVAGFKRDHPNARIVNGR